MTQVSDQIHSFGQIHFIHFNYLYDDLLYHEEILDLRLLSINEMNNCRTENDSRRTISLYLKEIQNNEKVLKKKSLYRNHIIKCAVRISEETRRSMKCNQRTQDIFTYGLIDRSVNCGFTVYFGLYYREVDNSFHLLKRCDDIEVWSVMWKRLKSKNTCDIENFAFDPCRLGFISPWQKCMFKYFRINNERQNVREWRLSEKRLCTYEEITWFADTKRYVVW